MLFFPLTQPLHSTVGVRYLTKKELCNKSTWASFSAREREREGTNRHMPFGQPSFAAVSRIGCHVSVSASVCLHCLYFDNRHGLLLTPQPGKSDKLDKRHRSGGVGWIRQKRQSAGRKTANPQRPGAHLYSRFVLRWASPLLSSSSSQTIHNLGARGGPLPPLLHTHPLPTLSAIHCPPRPNNRDKKSRVD